MGRQVYRTCFISCPSCPCTPAAGHSHQREIEGGKVSESIIPAIHTSFFIHIRARKKLIHPFWGEFSQNVISPPQGLLQSESSDYLQRWSYSNEMWSAHKSHGSSRFEPRIRFILSLFVFWFGHHNPSASFFALRSAVWLSHVRAWGFNWDVSSIILRYVGDSCNSERQWEIRDNA